MIQTLPQIILASERKEDFDFFSNLCKAAGKTLQTAQSWRTISELLIANPSAFVVWDADHAGADNEAHPLSATMIRTTLGDFPNSYALTSKPINLYDNLFSALPDKRVHYQNNILRRYEPATATLIKSLFSTDHDEGPFGLARFFSPTTRIQKIVLHHSDERTAASNAMESFLEKSGMTLKIAAKIAQASDELLMNAIFSAPRDKIGNATRQNLVRTAKFPFSEGETVELETALADDYAGLCVTDRFGSLQEENVVKFLGQNFQTHDYMLRKYGSGAGLGMYGIVQSGLSLFFRVMPGKRTDAMIFFKRTASVKEFKTGFQFTAAYFSNRR